MKQEPVPVFPSVFPFGGCCVWVMPKEVVQICYEISVLGLKKNNDRKEMQ